MIHRLALFMGGTGAAGVAALALLMGGFGAPLASTTDAAVALSRVGIDGGQLPATTPGQAVPTVGANLDGGVLAGVPEKVIDTVYVMPAPGGNGRGSDNDGNQPTDTPRPPQNGNDNGGDSQAGDDQGDDSDADEADDDDADEDAEDGEDEDHDDSDEAHDGDGSHDDDGSDDDGGDEPGED